MSSVQLLLVIHNHQPVGNFDTVIDGACDKAYLPLLKLLAKFPKIKLGLHTSGCLWEWLESHRPEYGVQVAELVKRGQLELLGGGMYEPILPVLPRRDALWQLQRMNRFLQERFGTEPRGMWCPERVWEPHLPEVIAAAGLEYTLLDDYHFSSSAMPDNVAREYFVTEHAGHTTALFPISKRLRYTMPFKPVKATFEYLRELAADSEHPPLVVFGDDGEKFGVWPETYEWVYEKGWLLDFFTALKDNLDWIDLRLPGEVLDTRRPAGKVFVPCMSYTEMGVWSRVNPDAEDNELPGFWRNFLHKYPESNSLYRRMLGVSELLERARGLAAPAGTLDSAAHDLGRAQCNCAYWHGVFGGLYLNYLRQAVSHHTIQAEQVLFDACPELGPIGCETTDHDGLGWLQHVLRSATLTAIADAGRGLCLTHLDYRPTRYCWTDVLARKREAYHAKVVTAGESVAAEHESIHDRVVVKEKGLAERLVFDPHQRVSFTTYFSDIETPEQLMVLPQPGQSAPCFSYRDYSNGASEVDVRDGVVRAVIDHGAFRLAKSIQLVASTLPLSVSLVDGAVPAEAGDFCVEFNLTLLTDQAQDRYLNVDGSRQSVALTAVWPETKRIELVDGWQHRALRLHSPQLKRILYYPVYTVSSSEGGFERTYQGSCIIFSYSPQALAGGIEINLEIAAAPSEPEGKQADD